MRSFPAFLLGAAAGAGLMFSAMHYHVVRAQDGMHWIKKARPRLAEVYVDIRSFGVNEWAEHKEMAFDISQAGKQHLLINSASSIFEQGVGNVMEPFQSTNPPQQDFFGQ